MKQFTFVKVNDDYPIELDGNRLDYGVFYEHDFPLFNPDLQRNGYHQSSVLYHIHKNKTCNTHDYIGFIEYDHVLTTDFTKTIHTILEEANEDIMFALNKFTFHELWEQGIIINPWRPNKLEGEKNSRWNCLRVILDDYNKFFSTNYTMENLMKKNVFPICHCFLIPTKIFEKIMALSTYIIESGRLEQYYRTNWRGKAIIMERYWSVALALEEAKFIDSICLEHRSYPIKVTKPHNSNNCGFRGFFKHLFNHAYRHMFIDL
jgi:hypothetical protein